MVYPTREFGQAVGEIVSGVASSSGVSEIRITLTPDRLVTEIHTNGKTVRRSFSDGDGGKRKEKGPCYAKMKLSADRPITCGDKTMTIQEWADKLGVTLTAIKNRLIQHGNPYGNKGPSNRDKIVAGS